MNQTEYVDRPQQRQYDPARLCFRRQFVLGPDFVNQFQQWNRLNIGRTLCATVHPDLGTSQATSDEKSVTLLGFMLNPSNPEATDLDIVNGLLSDLQLNDNLDAFVESTSPFGGRWVLIVDNGREVRLFHDAAGLRQVFYTQCTASQTNWCASDPGVIAEMLGLSVDTDAHSFIASYERLTREYWWPGDTSLYSAIRRLLPNHYLDLNTHSPQRYWPATDLPDLSLADCLQRSSELLLRMMDSAHKRFRLAVTVTAGWDSRVALAATRDIRHDVMYFTLMYWELSPESDDIRIPSMLLRKLGLPHHVIACPSTMRDEFARIYNRNVTTAREVYGTIAQGLFNAFPEGLVMVKGVVSEVARCWYRQRVPDATSQTVTPRMLAQAVEMEENAFVLTAYNRWLADINRTVNVDTLDLLFWEQRMGSWQAMSQLEWDIVQDVFTPFNCRTLLTQFLSVDRKYRSPQNPILYSELMKLLWPEVLSEPINPSKKKERVRTVIQQFVSDSPMRRFVPQRMKRLGRRLLYPERRFSRER